jgi:hypothetical protein
LRNFDAPGGRLRHAFQPVISWSYAPEVLFDGEESVVSVFGLEPPLAGHRFEVGLVNRVLFRPVDDSGKRRQARQLLDLTVGQLFTPDTTDVGSPFGRARVSVGRLNLNATAQMTEDAKALEVMSLFMRVGAMPIGSGLSGSYVYGRTHDVSQLRASVWLIPGKLVPAVGRLSPALSHLRLDGVTRYDLSNPPRERWLSRGVGLTYVSPCQCWSISLGVTEDIDRETYGFTFKIEPQVPKRTSRLGGVLSEDSTM